MDKTLQVWQMTFVLLSIAGVATSSLDRRQIHGSNSNNVTDQNDNVIVKDGISFLPKSVVPENATLLSSTLTDTFFAMDMTYMPEVGNGHIATVVRSDSIFMNGLYNGANTSSHRARISSTSGYTMSPTLPTKLSWKYTLDVGRGIFTETWSNPDANITLMTYAHKVYTSLLVTELMLSRDMDYVDIVVDVNLNQGADSEDVDLDNSTVGVTHGRTREAEHPELANTTEFFMKTTPSLKGRITMTAGRLSETYLSLTAIHVSKDVVLKEYELGIEAFLNNTLLSQHVEEWNRLWSQGRIGVEGDITIAKLNYASLYYILSSLPSHNDVNSPFIGLSPGGLAHGAKGRDYQGHVFWDQDIWMFPPIAMLYPDLGRSILSTRTKTLNAAKIWAEQTGWEGARFVWESAFTGLETCPAIEPLLYQIHVTGDVTLMVREYWQLTNDTQLMVNETGADVVWETARYWASRVTYSQDDDMYHIYDVMPPDEYHSPVNDSVYTNYIAQINLRFANQLAQMFGQPENKTWTEISEKLYIPYDEGQDYHPEFADFYTTETVKQADVVLLGYPLMMDMNDTTRQNDLELYEGLTPNGPAPAMTWGMFLLGWLELGNETKAADLFSRSVINAQQPFLVWTENADGSGATNFITGMGGYLQAVLFGYGGARLYDDRMTFDPKLITGTTKVKFTGLNYQGCSFDLEYSDTQMTLNLTSVGLDNQNLDVLFESEVNWIEMVPTQAIDMSRQSFVIRSSL